MDLVGFSNPLPICIIGDKPSQGGKKGSVERGFGYWLTQLKKIDGALTNIALIGSEGKEIPKAVVVLIFQYTQREDFYDLNFAKDLTSLFNGVVNQMRFFCSYKLTIGDHIMVFSKDSEGFNRGDGLEEPMLTRKVKIPPIIVEVLCPKETVVELCAIKEENGVEVVKARVKKTWGQCTTATLRPPIGSIQWEGYIKDKKN